MQDHHMRSFALLRGQSAPRASNGRGVRILYTCPGCQRIWLQDGKRAILDLSSERLPRLAEEVSANLTHLPVMSCRMCLYRAGGGTVSIDEYARGEGFGLCWEMLRPEVIHATCAMQSKRCASLPEFETKADVLTQKTKLMATLHAVKSAQPPRTIQLLPPAICQLQATDSAPGLGQPGTAGWQWKGWLFLLPCEPLGGEAIVTVMLALPPREPVSPVSAFGIWQSLLEVALQTL